MPDLPSQPSSGTIQAHERLAELLDRYSQPLVLYARQLCSAPDDAVQVAFIKLAELSTWPDDCGAWLYRVVRNEALQQLRSERRRRKREQAFAETQAAWFDKNMEASLDAETVTAALRRLPPSQREIVTVRIWGGLAFREIADLVGISASSARREYQRAIELLQNDLNEPCQKNPPQTT